MSKVWLHIIGMSEGGFDDISSTSQVLIKSAKIIIGSKRLLQELPNKNAQNLMEWKTPFKAMIEQILALRGSEVVILASGDGNWFGIGASMLNYLDEGEFISIPAVSSLQLAASKMHWPIQGVDCISLHGRAVENLSLYLSPNNKILALTTNANTLDEVALLLDKNNYSNSKITVLENLGSDDEQVFSFEANNSFKQKIGDFFTLAIECVSDLNTPLLTRTSGLPDEAFISDGQLTKCEVRAITLAKLMPYKNALLWDIGAGSGSIGIEWMRAAQGAKAICFERNKNRIEMIKQNSFLLGTPALKTIVGEAIAQIKTQPIPDAIFIGADVANDETFEACFKALKIGGRMVINAVTLEGEKSLFERHEKLGGELSKIDISRVKQVGRYRVFEPKKPVTQWLIIKEEKQ